MFCKGFLVEYEHMFGTLEKLREERKALDAHGSRVVTQVAAYDRSDDWRAEGLRQPGERVADVPAG